MFAPSPAYFQAAPADAQFAQASSPMYNTIPCQCAECLAAQQPRVVSMYSHRPYAPLQPTYAPAAPHPSAVTLFTTTTRQPLTPPAPIVPVATAAPLSYTPSAPRSPPSTPPPEKSNKPQMVVSLAMLEDTCGRMVELSRTPSGSSFLQAALRDRDPAAFTLIMNELSPVFGELLLDAQACYVVRSLMEHMSSEDLIETVRRLSEDEQLIFSLCTHSLHTRRMIQYLLETIPASELAFMTKLMKHRCKEVAKTQQGCIAMQRALDRCTVDEREDIFDDVKTNIIEFSIDPFANYVVQYMLEVGQKDEVSRVVVEAFKGRVVELACNKFASNVVEKCLFHVDGEAQHALLTEMYAATDDQLVMMLDDSFGNYIIQSSIALATFRDVWMISERLSPILQKVPYGYKIESRLARRLKGKTAMGVRGRP